MIVLAVARVMLPVAIVRPVLTIAPLSNVEGPTTVRLSAPPPTTECEVFGLDTACLTPNG